MLKFYLSMSTCIIIPARVKSQRIPNKPLVKVTKKDFLLLRTYKRLIKFFPKTDIYITTDSKKVIKKMNSYTENLILIKKFCLNGTERCSHALKYISKEYSNYLIISCDMPFMDGKIVTYLKKKAKKFKNFDGLTVHAKIIKKDIINNRSVAKLILNKDQSIRLISRKEIIYKKLENFSHHGFVLLKKKVLENYKTLKNTKLQIREDNEWLKLIENKYKIYSFLVKSIKPEINTKKDLKKYFPIKFKNI